MKLEFNAKWGIWTEEFDDEDSFEYYIRYIMTKSDTLELYDRHLNEQQNPYELWGYYLNPSDIAKELLPDEYETDYNEFVDSEIMIAWNELEDGDATYIFGMDIKVHEE